MSSGRRRGAPGPLACDEGGRWVRTFVLELFARDDLLRVFLPVWSEPPWLSWLVGSPGDFQTEGPEVNPADQRHVFPWKCNRIPFPPPRLILVLVIHSLRLLPVLVIVLLLLLSLLLLLTATVITTTTTTTNTTTRSTTTTTTSNTTTSRYNYYYYYYNYYYYYFFFFLLSFSSSSSSSFFLLCTPFSSLRTIKRKHLWRV